MGRFKFNTHQLVDQSGFTYNSASDFFPVLKGKEWYRTVGFKEIAIIMGDVVSSYRSTTKLINRVRYQQLEGTPYLRGNLKLYIIRRFENVLLIVCIFFPKLYFLL